MEARKNYSLSRGPCSVYLQISQEKPVECPPGHRRTKIRLPGYRPVLEQESEFDPTKNCVSTLAGADCPCTCCIDKFCRCDGLVASQKCPCWFCKREQGKRVIVNG